MKRLLPSTAKIANQISFSQNCLWYNINNNLSTKIVVKEAIKKRNLSTAPPSVNVKILPIRLSGERILWPILSTQFILRTKNIRLITSYQISFCYNFVVLTLILWTNKIFNPTMVLYCFVVTKINLWNLTDNKHFAITKCKDLNLIIKWMNVDEFSSGICISSRHVETCLPTGSIVGSR